MNGPRLYLGIDPGVSGGIAAIDGDGRVRLVSPMGSTEADTWAFVSNIVALSRNEAGQTQVFAAIERVAASPQMGRSSAFTFGRAAGMIRMSLVAAEIPFDEVAPGVWQKAIGIRQKTGKTELGTTHQKDKNINKARAQQLFPGVPITHAVADALLIAEFCRRSRVGQLAEAV
jgi:Holliday junction resolvasome RuvABC endonuclease subunit